MPLPEDVIARLEALVEELERLIDCCDRRLLRRVETQEAISGIDESVVGLLPAGSDAFRIFDRQVRERGEWWEVHPGAYAPPSDCNKFRHRRDVLRAILEGQEAEFLRAEQRPRGQWYFSDGQRFAAMRRVFGLMRFARLSLGVVDPYLDETIFDYLESLDRGVGLRVLTTERRFPIRLAAVFGAERGSFEARECADCHDRFFVVDDAAVYHLGASINRIGERACMIHRVDDPAERERFLVDYRAWWERGAPLG
jgi:hypothetical protein